MLPHHVIRRPVLTEKSTFGMNERRQYTFEVDRRATKQDIRRAVETLYRVRVLSVNTMVRKGGRRRLRYGVVEAPTIKRAIVRLHPEDTIELF